MSEEMLIHTFPNLGFISKKLSNEELSPIWKEVNQIKENFTGSSKANNQLAGNMENEFHLFECHNDLENLVLPVAYQYEETFKYFQYFQYTNKNVPLRLAPSWVNFQKKHEFNPNHRHFGVLSYVIWLQVPYSLEDEKKMSPGKDANENVSGKFEFSFSNILGMNMNHTLPVDKSMEGQLIIFPSTLTHAVYPFYTSDDYRISVAGNLAFMEIE